nr:immunoglobulin light chain junction region [Macaca mulatta]MOV72519.1 immunoglobulin light chain junction region [Macaca mulatta]
DYYCYSIDINDNESIF